MYKLKKNWKGI